MLGIIQNIISYADDTAILCSETTREKTQCKIQLYLNVVSYWLYKNSLSFNTNKKFYLTFSNKINTQPNKFNIFLNNVELRKVNSIKYLGLIFDQHMRWEIHRKFRYLLSIFYLN